MAHLLRKIQGEVLNNIETNVIGFRGISAEIQFEDYINLRGFIAYLQNFVHTESVIPLDKPPTFGLINKNNIQRVELQINY